MQKPGKWAAIKGFFTHERTRFITGLVISILTIYVGLALLSFFFTGAADQSKVENVSVEDLLANKGSVENWTGVRGAFIADWLMNRLFGVSSFMIVYFFGSLGARLMSIRRINILNRFIFCLATLIWGSWALAFFFIDGYKDTFIYLGGQQGYYVTEILKDNIGIPGTFLLSCNASSRSVGWEIYVGNGRSKRPSKWKRLRASRNPPSLRKRLWLLLPNTSLIQKKK